MMNGLSGVKLIIAALAVAAIASASAAQSYKLEPSATPAPSELAAGIRDALGPDALHVTGPDGAVCEIWLRKSIPAAAAPDTSLGVNFGQITQGALVGAIKFDVKEVDYRNQPIQPGVYTLRFMLQPVDGNHQGVSAYRDYVLAVPAALDSSPADIPTADLLKVSRKAAGTGHPSVWSLVPADTAPATLPGIAHQDDGDLWIAFFNAPLTPPAKMGLVVVGHAAEPE
ncbi:MAG TPA: hypothetical protein VLY23_05350 [Candidatus Acidoferrum sp.]|nr:hypothetical protein [Candidatus Acidoferrum sp.]